MPFLDIHILQTVPPSNINRDDGGSPKTALYGGVRRARVSSQAWKRAVRKAFEQDPALKDEAGHRTRLLPQVIGERLLQLRPDLDAKTADTIGLAAATATFMVKAPKKNTGRPSTEYLVFLGEQQITRIVERLAEHVDELAGAGDDLAAVVGGLGLEQLGVTGHAGAVALFGRMIADNKENSVDAACQVAHALSTHEVSLGEFDYYTAVDDEAEDRDESGAGMIGTVEFNSATLYRYANVDLRGLIENLDGETERALDLAVAFARCFAQSMPTGKQNTFANRTRPDLVLLCVRDDQPVNLVGAFEHPIRAVEGGLYARSVAQLIRYMGDQDVAYGGGPALLQAIYPAWLGDRVDEVKNGTELPPPIVFADALSAARAELSRLITDPA